MRVHVKFFAIFRELIGVKTEWKEIKENTSVEQLWTEYASRKPSAVQIRAAYAVNQKLVSGDHVLHDGDEVGFLPPVSGGAKRSSPRRRKATQQKRARASRLSSAKDSLITRRPLNLASLIRRVAFPGAGAIITFSGVVRDNAHGKSVDHLEYEAYPGMAEQTLGDIAAEIHERWPDVRVAMAHRIGRLKIGQASLMIAVSAPHRPEAYAASRYAIERVKAILPVWKKEFASDGEHWVEGPVAGELGSEKAQAVVQSAESAINTSSSVRQ